MPSHTRADADTSRFTSNGNRVKKKAISTANIILAIQQKEQLLLNYYLSVKQQIQVQTKRYNQMTQEKLE